MGVCAAPEGEKRIENQLFCFQESNATAEGQVKSLHHDCQDLISDPHIKTPGMRMQVCNSSTGEAETRGPLGLVSHQPSLVDELRVQ